MTTSSLGAFIQSLITIIKTDALKVALPVITTFFTNVSANPTQLNIVAQLGVLEAGLIGALPTLEGDVIKDLTALLQAEVATLESGTAAATTAA